MDEPSTRETKQLVVRLAGEENIGSELTQDASIDTESIAKSYPGFMQRLKAYPAAAYSQLFSQVSCDTLTRLLSSERQEDAFSKKTSRRQPLTRDSFNFLKIEVPKATAEGVLEQLQADPSVAEAFELRELATLRSEGGTPGAQLGKQGHLEPSRTGIDATLTRKLEGCDGRGVHLVDVERGWQFDHPDLRHLKLDRPISGENNFHARHHGTNVLGTICGRAHDTPNSIAGGIVPNCTVAVAAHEESDMSAAMTAAIEHLEGLPGSIILLETEIPTVAGLGPAETQPDIRLLIRKAVDRDLTVVECAGNSGLELDDHRLAPLGLTPGTPQFSDSGAILVSAATSGEPHQRIGHPIGKVPAGKRVNCFSWGENIACPNADSTYTDNFQGTSGAGAIIAGVAVAVQGFGKQHFKQATDRGYFDPYELRAILSNPNTGTSSGDGSLIGVMPDLSAIINHMSRFDKRDLYVQTVVEEVRQFPNQKWMIDPFF